MASTRRCKNCKTKNEKFVVIGLNAFCDNDFKCASEFGRSESVKDKQKADKKKHTARKKEFRLNDTTHQHKLTQAVFNKLRVAEEKQWFSDRGLEPTCISCGKPNMDWCCGHFKTRGSQGNLRYDRNNTFLQCNRYCNMALSGNINGNKTTRGYIKGLFERFGDDKANEIIDYCTINTKPKKWTGEELAEMRADLNKLIKHHEKRVL